MEKPNKERYGDEAPTGRDILIVFIAVGLLILISWVAWHQLGWFH